jgi:vacuolar-type H+-ATPase subunit E/Vma4
MSEDIRALIEKINQEGVIAAEKKAKEIEDKARLAASEILKRAQAQADKILEEAKDEISRMQEKEKSLLNQAGRDLILILRQEINAMLNNLINSQVKDALEPDNLFKILSKVIQGTPASAEKGEIIVLLNKEDLKALENGLLAKLKEETKRKIVLKAADDIRAGFVISYDAGKSQFDFSDKALAEYIGTFLKPKLKEILGV